MVGMYDCYSPGGCRALLSMQCQRVWKPAPIRLDRAQVSLIALGLQSPSPITVCGELIRLHSRLRAGSSSSVRFREWLGLLSE